MKKKTFALFSSVIAVSFAACFPVLRTRIDNSVSYATGDNHDHTVIFTGSDVTPGEYEEDYYSYFFVLSKENAIVVNETEKYDIQSVEGRNRCYTAPDTVTWGGDNIAVIESGMGYEWFSFQFKLLKRAALNLDKCVVDYYVNDVYNNVKFSVDYEDGDYCYYKAEATFYDAYEKKVEIRQVKLVFSC